MARQPVEVAIAILMYDGAVLVGRRDAQADLGGMLEFPGGKLEPGESSSEAVVRECREETGLAVEVIGHCGWDTHHYDHAVVHLHFLLCRPIPSTKLANSKHRWVPIEELDPASFPPANARVLSWLKRL